MCGRFQIAAPFRVLVALYRLGPPPAGTLGLDPAGPPGPGLLPRLNVGPTQVAPVVCGTGRSRYAVPMRWGFHHRGPVIIEPEQWDSWLDPALDTKGVAALLHPVADGVLRFAPVGTAVNNVRQATPDLNPGWSLDQLADPQLPLITPT